MCGIVGLFGKEFTENDINNALNTISHRGKDATGIFRVKNGFLGHKRLSIIDLDTRSNQPFISANQHLITAYNGETYNYEELKKEFNLFLQTGSDTEVITELYNIVRYKLPDLINGMYALAIFDKQNNELFLARDHAGIKPLFYYIDNEHLAFASEIKALKSIPYIQKRLKLSIYAISLYLRLGFIPEPYTIYENIYKFPANHYGIYKNGNLKIHPYHFPIPFEKQTENLDFENASVKLRYLLESSVKYRLISDVPVGVLLSGGIDSTLVAALAQKISGSTPLKTFTIALENKDLDEALYAKQIAKYLATNHHEFLITEKETLELIPDLITTYDEPFADSSAIPSMLIFKYASQHVKVTLSGDGGDELFGGYGAYNWAKRLDKIPAFAYPVIKSALNKGDNRKKRASLMFNNPDTEDIYSHILSVEQYLFSYPEAKQIAPQLAVDNIVATRLDKFKGYSNSERQMIFDYLYYLRDDLLVKIDRASMKYTVENRVPLLDKRIVEFAFSLKEELKIKDNNLKLLPKELLSDYIPKQLFQRPKKGFSIPLKEWLKNELKPLVEEFFLKLPTDIEGLFDTTQLETLKQQYYNGSDHLYNKIWSVTILNYWFHNQKQ